MLSSRKLGGKEEEGGPHWKLVLDNKEKAVVTKFFEFELAPYTTSLYDNVRWGKRESSYFTICSLPLMILNEPYKLSMWLMVASCFIKWVGSQDQNPRQLFPSYIEYLKNNYGKTPTIVF